MRTMVVIQLLLAATFASADTLVCFEAESSTNIVADMQVGGADIAVTNKGWTAVADASAGKYLELPQSAITNAAGSASGATNKVSVQGSASFEFTVPDKGAHQLWCRVWWLDTCGNSLSISIDGARPMSFGQDRTFKSWHWVKAPKRLKQLDLTAGKHTMVISGREDGVRVDQVLLTDDPDYVPVGIEDVTQAAPAPEEEEAK